jgi:hypothetical protein
MNAFTSGWSEAPNVPIAIWTWPRWLEVRKESTLERGYSQREQQKIESTYSLFILDNKSLI